MSTPTTPTEKPRWRLVVTPNANKDPHDSLSVFAPDVPVSEVLNVLLKLCARYSGVPAQLLPTVAQVLERGRLQALLEEHPAVHLFTRDGRQLWLGAAALEELGEQLEAEGWSDAGEAPGGMRRICDRAGGAFRTDEELEQDSAAEQDSATEQDETAAQVVPAESDGS